MSLCNSLVSAYGFLKVDGVDAVRMVRDMGLLYYAAHRSHRV